MLTAQGKLQFCSGTITPPLLLGIIYNTKYLTRRPQPSLFHDLSNYYYKIYLFVHFPLPSQKDESRHMCLQPVSAPKGLTINQVPVPVQI